MSQQKIARGKNCSEKKCFCEKIVGKVYCKAEIKFGDLGSMAGFPGINWGIFTKNEETVKDQKKLNTFM